MRPLSALNPYDFDGAPCTCCARDADLVVAVNDGPRIVRDYALCADCRERQLVNCHRCNQTLWVVDSVPFPSSENRSCPLCANEYEQYATQIIEAHEADVARDDTYENARRA